MDYLKNQKRELGNYIYNNLNNLKSNVKETAAKVEVEAKKLITN